MQVILGSLYDKLRSQKLWVSVGVIICFVSLLLALSFFSNVKLGYIDQANLEDGLPGEAHNWFGRWGAIVADYFMADRKSVV